MTSSQMGGLGKNVIFILLALIGAANSQSCSIAVAESALANRTEQFKQVIRDPKNANIFKTLCLTQIRTDSTEENFDDAIKLCTNAEVDIIQQKWVNLNLNITQMCEEDCPDILRLPICKNMTYLEEIEFSRYEKFCVTFRDSYACAQNAMNTCGFGVALYADILEPIVLQYWTYICNSGCGNIDETVAVITKCLAPLKKVDKSKTCMAHYEFKECIRQEKSLCPEYLKLVKFIYRKYNAIDRYCTTTTTVTTTPLPEITTPLTETPKSTELLTESTPIEKEIPTEKLEVTKMVTTEENTQKMTTEVPDVIDNVEVKIEDCLSTEDLEVISAGEINLSSIVVYLKLESCLHNTTTDTQTLSKIRDSFPVQVQSFHSRIKSEAWLIAQQVLQQQAQCKQDNEEETKGCSGHGYGLIPCNSVEIPTMNVLVNSLCLILAKTIYTWIN